jgi:hypothetical protein
MSIFSKVRREILMWYIKGVVNDARKGRYGTMFAKVWKWLDGRKMAIGLALTFAADVAPRIAEIIQAAGGDSTQFSSVSGQVLVILGALHKVLKGR